MEPDILKFINVLVQPTLVAITVMTAFATIVGAAKSGAIKRVRFGSFEVAAADREIIGESIRSASGGQRVPFEVEQLTNYYSQILAQSKVSFWFSLVFASVGFVAILLAAFLYSDSHQGTTVAQFVAGTIMEAVASLFFVQSRGAQKSMGEFFDKLRKDRLHMESRNLCDDIEETAIKDGLKLHLSLHYAGVDGAGAIAREITESVSSSRVQVSKPLPPIVDLPSGE